MENKNCILNRRKNNKYSKGRYKSSAKLGETSLEGVNKKCCKCSILITKGFCQSGQEKPPNFTEKGSQKYRSASLEVHALEYKEKSGLQ